jgi:toxin ParE1/3/4
VGAGRVTRRPEAEVDVVDIWGNIAEDSGAEADSWVDRLDEKLQLWATQPLIGKPVMSLSLA